MQSCMEYECFESVVLGSCVCVCECVCVFKSKARHCSFVAHSCPTFGISRNSPGTKGFSEGLLIGYNLPFKLESRQAFPSWQVFGIRSRKKRHFRSQPRPCPLSGAFFLSSSHRLTPPATVGPGVNSYSVVRPSGDEA